MLGRIIHMKKSLFLLPVGVFITLFSVAGMDRVNASNEYTFAYYADFSAKILSEEQSFTKQQAEPEIPAAMDGTDGSGYYSIPAGDYIYIEGTSICYPLVQGRITVFI